MKLCGAVCLAISAVVFGQTYTISTFAGGGPPDNLPATSVALNTAQGIASDPAGNLFIATSDSVFRMDAITGRVSKILATGAIGIAADPFGNVYIATDRRVQKIFNGNITTVAGTGGGFFGFLGDNGPAVNAVLAGVSGVAVDAAGNLYIADRGSQRIRNVSNGIITTIAGTPSCHGTGGVGFFGVVCDDGFSGDDGPATSARLGSPSGVAVDAAGNVYIADTHNGRIRQVANGVITTIAGGGVDSGENVPATSALVSFPGGVAADSSGNLYVAESSSRVRRITNGIIATVAGTGTPGFSGDNGPAIDAQLNFVRGVAVDLAGNLYIADDNRMRKVSNGIITTVAGNGERSFSGDGGPATDAVLSRNLGVMADLAGNIYIADVLNHRVRKVSNGVITTVAGTGIAGFSGDDGPAIGAQLNSPGGMAMDSDNNLYILDAGNNRIRKVSNGVITTVAGNGIRDFSSDNIPATNAAISVTGIAVDADGVLYFSESAFESNAQARVRKIVNGVLTTVAGLGQRGFSGDNGPATSAYLDRPGRIAFDAAGNLYISDTGRVRKVSNGVITTVVVNPQEPFAVDSAGNLYLSIVTVLNSVVSTHIRKASNGAITYIAGNGTRGFSGDNGPALDAQLSEVSGLAVDSSGNVYVADTANLRIRVLTPIPVIPPPPSPDLTITQAHPGDFRQGQFGATYSITVGNSGNDPSNGTVTVTLADQTSQGLITTSMTGLGWTCTQPAGPCTRADALAPGTYHPAIRVTLNVALDAPATVISAASVAGGGETYVDNDTAFDFTVITTIPPRITSMSPNPASSIAGLQTIFINGSGFSNVIAVRITGPGGQSDLQFDAVGHFGIGQLSVKIDPGGTAATWTAQVILRNGQTSNIFPFSFSQPVTTSFALPQFVFGGSWYTALYFSNTTQTAENITVNFVGNDGAPLNVPLAGIGTVSSHTFGVNPKSTVMLEALNNAGSPGEGWVETNLPTGVVGHAVFRQVVVGRADQEAVVPLTPESSQIADLIYDDTLFSTAVAFLNPTNQATMVTIATFNADGSPAGTSQIPLAARSKLSAVLKNLAGLEGILGKRGRAVFSASSGAVSVLGLRFGGSAFTSIPVVHRPAVPETNSTTFALPQFVFGDPWYTAIYLSNTTDATQSVPVNFLGNNGAQLNARLTGIGPTFFRMVTLNPGATEVLEAPNTGGLAEGWVEVVVPQGVTGYAVFRQVIAGRENQEAVVPLTSEGNLAADLIYDDVQFTTSVAMLNPNTNSLARVTITAYSANGAQVGAAQIDLPTRSKVATILRDLQGLQGMAGNRGWVTFSTPFGNVSVLGLRFGGEAFTSIPVTSR